MASTHDPEGFLRDLLSRVTMLERRISMAGMTRAVPVGAMVPWAGGSTAPARFLIADGSAVSRTTYADLFAAIGTTYGAGDGTTTFNLPDTRGRVIVGQDSSQTEFDTVGETGGAKTQALTFNQLPKGTGVTISWGAAGNVHFDNVQAIAGASSGNGIYTVQNDPAWDQGASSRGQGHNNLQPYIVARYIIAY